MPDTLIKRLRELVESNETTYSSESSLEVKFQAGEEEPIVDRKEVVDRSRGHKYVLIQGPVCSFYFFFSLNMNHVRNGLKINNFISSSRTVTVFPCAGDVETVNQIDKLAVPDTLIQRLRALVGREETTQTGSEICGGSRRKEVMDRSRGHKYVLIQ